MAKTKISEFSATPANNTDIDSINIAEGCAPSGINDAIRELMAQLKDFQTGAVGDSFNGPIGTSTAAAGAFTTLTTSSTVTHNGGTANGVTYLNGSKVLTSGSALTFDGTNLGVGVTPSASALSSLQVKQGSIANGSNNNTFLLSNAFNGSGGWTYIGSDTASMYQQAAGQHRFFTTASGTAGNAITWTQAMTLDASGNLGIGTSSPTQKLDVYGNGMKVNNASYVGYLGAGNTFAGGAASDFCVRSDNVLSFATNGPYERARIDSSGYFYIGCSAVPSATVSGAAWGFGGTNSYWINAVSTTGTATQYAFFNGNGSVGSISTSGSVTSYNITSDQRLKQNIQDADSSSSLIDSLQVRKFDWKVDDSHQRYGFIAQELVTVAPEAVYQPDDADAMMAVDYSKLVPMLVKEIQSLRVRVAQLETN